MADDEHIEILRRGVFAWNMWREEHPNVTPNLCDADFAGFDLQRADLRGADLSHSYLNGVQLTYADMTDADLSHSHLNRTSLGYAKLSDAYLTAATFSGANLSGVDMRRAKAHGAKLDRAHLVHAVLSGADLDGADLSESDLYHAYLDSANLSGAKLNKTQLHSAILKQTRLIGANLREADLSYSDIWGAKFTRADATSASFVGAGLLSADFEGASLVWANFRNADLVGANFNAAEIQAALFHGVNLSNTEGLEGATYRGHSSIDTDTLYLSAGNIPRAFLEGCGVPEELIVYLPSLVGARRALQFYSCFISYNRKDAEFSARLHARLRDERIRVWFAPEDARGGDYLYEQIDRAIQMHDRLLVVLSENSLGSKWVQTEIRRARRAEVKGGRRKLFPIRLIDYDGLKEWECFDAGTGEDLAFELRKYYIPDFSNWRDETAFESAFNRLLRDLRAEENSSPPFAIP